MFVPTWVLLVAGLLVTALSVWTWPLVVRRNPLPFPDNGSRISSAASPQAKDAIVSKHLVHFPKPRAVPRP